MGKKELAFFTAALIIFSFVIIDIYWWINISSDYSKSLAQANKEYLEKFPIVINNGHYVSIINIIILTVAGFLFYKAKYFKKIKVISLILLASCIVIGSWQLFTLF